MNFRMKFSEQDSGFVARFGEIHNISDNAYERGYAAGHADGYTEGLTKRTYETWTVTLTDGTIVEKEVALL